MTGGFEGIAGKFRGTLLRNEPMSRHTSLKVGGTADLFAVPEDVEDLLSLLDALKDAGLSWMVVGGGYNLLVRDGGLRCAVISLESINAIEQLDDGNIKAWSGAENLALVRFGQTLCLGGLGFISGIPGTIGGALRMNAGAYGEGILSHAVSLSILRDGAVQEMPTGSFSHGYRRLDIERQDILLAATFRLVARDPAETEEEIRRDLELRRSKHNVGFPSAGSFFKNPPEKAAWRLIDEAGMRGKSVGGAQMSELHSNFLINRGDATASDCLELARLVKEAVLDNCGVLLEEEVKIVGEEP